MKKENLALFAGSLSPQSQTGGSTISTPSAISNEPQIPDNRPGTRPLSQTRHSSTSHISISTATVKLTDAERQVASAQEKARARIIAKYGKNHRIEVFAPGDFATLSLARASIPSSLSLPRIPCHILRKRGDCYEVQTKWGVLDHLQVTEVLMRLSDSTDLARSLPPPPSESEPYTRESLSYISLDSVLLKHRLDVFASSASRLYCVCRVNQKTGKRCTNTYCRCRKAGKSCTNHCHGEAGHPLAKADNCLNFALPEARGVAAIVDHSLDGHALTGTGATVRSLREQPSQSRV